MYQCLGGVVLNLSNVAVRAWFSTCGKVVYGKEYMDDPRNTDNAWLETIAVNFHDEDGSVLSDSGTMVSTERLYSYTNRAVAVTSHPPKLNLSICIQCNNLFSIFLIYYVNFIVYVVHDKF